MSELLAELGRIAKARIWFAIRRVQVTGRPRVSGKLPRIVNGPNIELGNNVRFTGHIQRSEIACINSNAAIQIGRNTFINRGVVICAAVSIKIGEDCHLADSSVVYDTDLHPVDASGETRRAPVELGRGIWLGRGAIVLPGVTIGDYAVVAAGAVVTGDVPARTLVAGAPARRIRDLEAPDGWQRP